MKRSAEKALTDWINNESRKPLIIRGARQVGKSTLVRKFAESSKLRLYEINLEKNLELDDIFKTLDVKRICQELEGLLEQKINPQHALLFLDEIQATPHALQALRYFYEDYPQLAVVSAGSLLEFALADLHFSMPVGRVEYLYLGPLTFEEYLFEAKPNLLSYIRDFDFNNPIPSTVHQKLLNLQREYMLIGGMPEAVDFYINKQDINLSKGVLQSIISTYQDDFSKYATRKSLLRLQKVFRSIPKMIGQKVIYSRVLKDETAREVRTTIDLLIKAKIISPVFHSDCGGIPLAADVDDHVYKPIYLDIGLLNRMFGIDLTSIRNMDERELVNEGPLAEQFIGQHLFYKIDLKEPPGLFYWLREKKQTNAEVDYVISQGNLVVPIEVKSGKSGTMKSLLQFVYLKKIQMGVRFDLNLASIQTVSHKLKLSDNSVTDVTYSLISLPLYLVGQLDRIIMEYRQRDS